MGINFYLNRPFKKGDANNSVGSDDSARLEYNTLSPKQYKAEYRKLKKKKNNIDSIYQVKIQSVRDSSTKKINMLQERRKELQDQYFVRNIYGMSVCVGEIIVNGISYSYEDLDIHYEMKKLQHVRYLKNGTPRYTIRNTKCIVLRSKGQSIDYAVDDSVANIKMQINDIKTVIADYPQKKNELDETIKKINNKIQDTEKKTNDEIKKIRDAQNKAHNELKKQIKYMKESASVEQKKEIFKSQRIASFIILSALSVIGALTIFSTITTHIETKTEEGRSYYVKINKTYTFDCEAKFDNDTKTISCLNQEIRGNFSNYETTILRSSSKKYITKSYLETSNNDFLLYLTMPVFYQSDYETEDFNIEDLVKQRSSDVIYVALHNNILHRDVATNKLKVNIQYSDKDKKILNDYHSMWLSKLKEEQNNKMTEMNNACDVDASSSDCFSRINSFCSFRVERKYGGYENKKICEENYKKYFSDVATEKQRAAEEQKRKEEAATAAAAARKKAAEQQQSSRRTPKSIASPNQTPGQSSTQPQSSNLPLKAMCADGTIQYQDTPSNPNYRGMCSGHGGIKIRYGRVP